MITVCRVENEKQMGPYQAGIGLTLYSKAIENGDADRCPGPIFEEIIRENHLFGFYSINQLKDWFNIFEREELAKRGFFVSVIETDEVYHCRSGKQIIFDKHCAKRVKRIDFSEI